MDWAQTLASILVGAVSGLAGGLLGYLGAKHSTRRDLIGPALTGLDACMQNSQDPDSHWKDVWKDCLAVRGSLYALGVPAAYARAHSAIIITRMLAMQARREAARDGSEPALPDWSADEPFQRLDQAFEDVHLVVGGYLASPLGARLKYPRRKYRVRRTARAANLQTLF